MKFKFRPIPLSTVKRQLTFNNLASTDVGRERKENTIRLWRAPLALQTNTRQS